MTISELPEFFIHLLKKIAPDVYKEGREFRPSDLNCHRGSQPDSLLAIYNEMGGFCAVQFDLEVTVAADKVGSR